METRIAVANNEVPLPPPVPPNGEQDTISLIEVWRVLVKRRFIIIGFFLVTFALVAIDTYRKTPIYEASAQIEIDPDQYTDVGLQGVTSQRFSFSDDSDRLSTEVQILQSDSVMLAVVKQLDLAHTPPFSRVFRGHPYQGGDFTPAQRAALLGMLKGSLTVKVIPDTKLVNVRFRQPDPKMATDVANAVVDAYMDRALNSRYQGTMRVSEWLSKQLDELKGQASAAQQKLADFQKQNNLLGTDETDNLTTQRLSQLNDEFTAAQTDRVVKEARYRMALTGNPELISSVASTSLGVLRSQEAELQVQRAELTSKFGPGYPKVPEIDAELNNLEGQINAEISNVGKRLQDDFLTAQKTESMLGARLDAQKAEAYKLNDKAAQYALLHHEAESTRDLYDMLQMRLKEAGVTAGLHSTDISVVDRAATPSVPILPNVRFNLLLGVLAGLIGGIALAFIVDAADDTLRTSDEVEAACALPSLGTVPHIGDGQQSNYLYHYGRRRKHLKKPELQEAAPAAVMPSLMTLSQPRSAVAESYRALRSSLLLTSVDNAPKSILVTSPFQHEGKSTTSVNLAIALAQSGAKVLLIDADLRRGSLHKNVGLTSKDGLTNLLLGQPSAEVIVQPIEELPNLYVLPAGRSAPMPAELLASNRVRELMEQWKQQYDHLVIDTAPLLAISDSLPLAARADAVLMVVRAGQTRRRALMRACELLHRTNAKLVGVVVNDIDMHLENFYMYSGAYGYRYKKYYYRNHYYEAGND